MLWAPSVIGLHVLEARPLADNHKHISTNDVGVFDVDIHMRIAEIQNAVEMVVPCFVWHSSSGRGCWNAN